MFPGAAHSVRSGMGCTQEEYADIDDVSAANASSRTPAPHTSLAVRGVQERLGFIDLARAAAALLMIQGHALDVLLLPLYRTGMGFHVWSFARGLTSCLFLFLSGFSFAAATHRGWARYSSGLQASRQRVARFAGFLGLGYLLHLPATTLSRLSSVSPAGWHGFWALDILQCIAVSLCALQALVLLTRTPRRFSLVSAAVSAVVVALTPAVWKAEPFAYLPVAVSSYFTARHGSLFPLFPWAGYMLLGATCGTRYQQRQERAVVFGTSTLLPLGVAMIVSAAACSRLPFDPFGSTDFWSNSPNLFLLRAGLVLLVVALMAHANRWVATPNTLVDALAQRTLLIYVVHVCVVYGSPWNRGLRQIYGSTLRLVPALGWVATLWITMALIAIAWNVVHTAHPQRARHLRLAGIGALIVSLL